MIRFVGYLIIFILLIAAHADTIKQRCAYVIEQDNHGIGSTFCSLI